MESPIYWGFVVVVEVEVEEVVIVVVVYFGVEVWFMLFLV